MRKFRPTYLYIKQHTVTGKFYFGKTTRDPEKYNGSGLHWSRHISYHGTKFVVTLWSCLFTDPDELETFAKEFSTKMQIVESNQWLNLKPENGFDGGTEKGSMSLDGRAAVSEARRGKAPWNKGIGKPKLPKIDKSVAYIGEGNPFFGKSHREESKLYGDRNPARRPEAREKMSGPRPGFMPHNHYSGWSQETKDKISASLTGKTRSVESREKQRQSMANLVWVHNGVDKPLQVKSHLLPEYVGKGYTRGRGPRNLW